MKISVIFVIQGKEFPIEVTIQQTVRSAVQRALKDAEQQGSADGWIVSTPNGTKLDLNKSFQDQNISSSIKISLTKPAGRGG